MTIRDFLFMCDTSDTTLEYIVINEDYTETELEYLPSSGWVSPDYTFDDNDEVKARIMISTEDLMDAELASVKPGQYTEIKLWL